MTTVVDGTPSKASSLSQMLATLATARPHDLAYALLDGDRLDAARAGDGEAALAVSRMTYAELDAAAHSHAVALREAGLALGARAILAFPAGLDFVRALFGCAYGGVVGVPQPVPKRRSDLERLRRVADDAGTRTVLTTRLLRDQLIAEHGGTPALDGLRLIATDEIETGARFAAPQIPPYSPVILQYTSGSTGHPKGVVVTNHNMCVNVAEINAIAPLNGDSRVVSWLPAFHDMGLVFGIILPMWAGVPVYIMSPAAFIRRPLRWLEAMSRLRATHTAAPNFAYESCVRDAEKQPPAGLDLSSLRAALTGAEPVRWDTVQRFTAMFERYGYRPDSLSPGYGLAEHTLKVCASVAGVPPTALRLDTAELHAGQVRVVEPGYRPASMVVSCGQPNASADVRIVDPATGAELAPGVVGEIWSSGPSVAAGYHGKPLETAETFHARMSSDPAAGPFLRTGDLGFLHGGEVYVTGRMKDVIIRYGRNHYPQDIEYTVESCLSGPPSSAAAFPVDRDGAEQLVVVVEADRRALRETTAAGVVDAIRQRVEAEHRLLVDDVVLIRRGTLPRTTSGKVRRRTCRDQYLDGELQIVGSSPRVLGS